MKLSKIIFNILVQIFLFEWFILITNFWILMVWGASYFVPKARSKGSLINSLINNILLLKDRPGSSSYSARKIKVHLGQHYRSTWTSGLFSDEFECGQKFLDRKKPLSEICFLKSSCSFSIEHVHSVIPTYIITYFVKSRRTLS